MSEKKSYVVWVGYEVEGSINVVSNDRSRYQ